MKDIYELLNYVEIEDEEIPEVDSYRIEKERVKNNLSKILKKRRYKKSAVRAATICCVLISSVGIFGIKYPTYAADMPIVGDIFRFLDNGRTGAFDKYQENSDGINITKEDKGISITIRDAVFDGYVLSYTYEVSCEKNLGDNIHLKRVSDGGDSVYSGNSTCKKISDGKYVGRTQIEISNEKKENINTIISYNKVSGFTDRERVRDVKGKWNFSINLDAVTNELQIVDKNVQKDGMNIRIESIQKTPMSFTVRYSREFSEEIMDSINSSDEILSEEEKMEQYAKWEMNNSVHLYIKDDLGNEYVSCGNFRGSGDENKMEFNDTFNKIDEKAKQLIITPKNSEVTFDSLIIDLK